MSTKINSNLQNVRTFLDEIHQKVDPSLEKIWSSERTVHYTSRVEVIWNYFLEGERDFSVEVNKAFFKNSSEKEKIFFWKILKLLALDDNRYAIFFLSYESFLDRTVSAENIEYFYLHSLTDNLFVYEMDCKLSKNTRSRRYLYRQLGSRFTKRNLFLPEVFEQYFITPMKEIVRRREKKLQRHKGYRDHGSLGSEFSKTVKQQSCDFSILEKELAKEQERNDLLEFLTAFSGHI